mgnify:FL=1
MIVDPWGRVLAEGDDKPGLIFAEIKMDAVTEARGRIPALRHTRPTPVSVY